MNYKAKMEHLWNCFLGQIKYSGVKNLPRRDLRSAKGGNRIDDIRKETKQKGGNINRKEDRKSVRKTNWNEGKMRKNNLPLSKLISV
jgi:hypothetical protein